MLSTYLLLCAVALCVLLEHTPLGWQAGTLSASDSARSSPAMAAYANAQWEEYDAVLQEDERITPHVTGSIAATRLAQWQMQLAEQRRAQNETALGHRESHSGLLPSTVTALAPASAPASGYALGPSFHLVTYASENSYASLLNLVGSAHLWEPALRVVVYDLGLLQEHVLELQCVDNLLLRPYSWMNAGRGGGSRAAERDTSGRGIASQRALIAHDALQHASSILLLAPTFELRQPLRGLKRILQRDGFLLTDAAAAAGAAIGADAAAEVALAGAGTGGMSFHAALRQRQDATPPPDTRPSPPGSGGGPTCAGDILGVVRNSSAYESLVAGAARCALEARCLATVAVLRRRRDRASGRKARALGAAADRLEQALLWGALDHGRGCNAPGHLFRQDDLARCPLRADRFWPEDSPTEGAVLCVRPPPPPPFFSSASVAGGGGVVAALDASQHYPAVVPYAARVRSNAICVSFMCAPEWVLRDNWYVRSGRQQKADPAYWAYHASVSRAAVPAGWWGRWGRRWAETALAGAAGRASHARILVVAGLRMPSAYALFAALAAALLRATAPGRRLSARHSKGKLFIAWSALWAAVFVVVQSIGANGVE